MRYLLALVCVVVTACAGPAPQGSSTPTLAPEPSVAPPTLATAEAAIAQASRIRADWGLESEVEWVTEVAHSPQAVDSALGIPLMPEEVEQLEQMFVDDPRSRLIAYGTAQSEHFGGAYVDRASGGLVMLFTADHARHTAALAALPDGDAVEVRPARFTEAELLAVMDAVHDEVAAMSSVLFVSTSLDTIGNLVRVEVKAPNTQIKVALESRFRGMVVVEVFPMPGAWHNRDSGAGWRLLAAGVSRSVEAYTVQAATTEEEWAAIWSAVDPVNEQPAVDLSQEIVAVFAHGVGSSCPEVRLDDVVIGEGEIYSVVSDPLQPRGCTDDLVGSAFFVVAIERDAIPPNPVTIRLDENPPGIAQEVVVDLD